MMMTTMMMMTMTMMKTKGKVAKLSCIIEHHTSIWRPPCWMRSRFIFIVIFFMTHDVWRQGVPSGACNNLGVLDFYLIVSMCSMWVSQTYIIHSSRYNTICNGWRDMFNVNTSLKYFNHMKPGHKHQDDLVKSSAIVIIYMINDFIIAWSSYDHHLIIIKSPSLKLD